MRRRSVLLALSSLAAGVGCSEASPKPLAGGITPTFRPKQGSVTLQDIPHVLQRPDFCGEACLEMAARYRGRSYDQNAVFDGSGVDPALGRGLVTRELAETARALGYDTGPVWQQLPEGDPAGLSLALAALIDDLHRGDPSIVCMHYDEGPNTSEHFRLVVGYDAAKDEILFHEPAEPSGAYRRMPRERFLQLWPLRYQKATLTLIRVALRPKELRDPAPPASGFLPSALVQHVISARARFEAAGVPALRTRIEQPFVVWGDDQAEELAQRAQTVSWAVRMLEADFFAARPGRILDVFLFREKASYDKGVLALTGEAPSTPYGFYSPRHGGLFMNIATGGGTLVHEIVHPYVEADFPNAPAWLNEGLGSLFEQCGERDGHIVGHTNWRLAGLQRALERGSVPSFRALCAMSERQFYEEDSGSNYGQARYLLHYLQEQGKLRGFYRAFRNQAAKDATGYLTLASTLGRPDMKQFFLEWSQYVRSLRFG